MKVLKAICALFVLGCLSFNLEQGSYPKSSASYKFDTSVEINMQSYKKNGKLKSEQKATLLTPDGQTLTYFAMEIDAGNGSFNTALYDFTSEKMVSLMEGSGMKNAVVIKMNKEKFQPDESDYDEDVSFKKTGNTKRIMGFLCYEYTAELEDGTNFYWVSKETSNGIMDFFIRAQNQKSKNKIAAKMPEGSVLELGNIDKKGEKFVMQVLEIKTNINKTIDLSNYRVIGKL